jgi:hypothetical protein
MMLVVIAGAAVRSNIVVVTELQALDPLLKVELVLIVVSAVVKATFLVAQRIIVIGTVFSGHLTVVLSSSHLSLNEGINEGSQVQDALSFTTAVSSAGAVTWTKMESGQMEYLFIQVKLAASASSKQRVVQCRSVLTFGVGEWESSRDWLC